MNEGVSWGYLYPLISPFRRIASTRSHAHKCVLYTIPGWRWFLPKRPRVNKHEPFVGSKDNE